MVPKESVFKWRLNKGLGRRKGNQTFKNKNEIKKWKPPKEKLVWKRRQFKAHPLQDS